MINKESTIDNIINVCRSAKTNRAQSYVSADSTSYGPNQQISFTFPNVMMDNTSAYLEATVQFVNVVAPVNRIQTLSFNQTIAVADIDALSNFRLQYQGYTSAVIFTKTATPAIVQGVLNNMGGPISNFFPITVGAADNDPTHTLLVTAFVINFSVGFGITIPDLLIVVAEDNFYTRTASPFIQIPLGSPFGGDINNPPTAMVPGSPLKVNRSGTGARDGSGGFPRLERFAPLVQIARVDFDSTNVININNCMVLQAMDMSLEGIDSQNPNYYYNNDSENGYFNDGQFRVKIHMKYIDILHCILPLDSVNSVVKVYLTLALANQCLIQSNSNQSFILSDVRWNYHRLILEPEEKMKIDAQIKGQGMVIPFFNWYDFTVNIPQAVQQNNIIFNPNCTNLLGVLFSFLSVPYSQNSANNRKFSTFLNNYIVNYRIKINEKYFPLNIVNTVDGSDMVEPIEELTRFTNMYKRYDYEEGQSPTLYEAYTIFRGQNDPTQTQFNYQFGTDFNQFGLMGISVCDVGYENVYRRCNNQNQALNGQNTANVTNVVLELSSMTLLNDCTLFLYSLHQDYLLIKDNSFVWFK